VEEVEVAAIRLRRAAFLQEGTEMVPLNVLVVEDHVHKITASEHLHHPRTASEHHRHLRTALEHHRQRIDLEHHQEATDSVHHLEEIDLELHRDPAGMVVLLHHHKTETAVHHLQHHHKMTDSEPVVATTDKQTDMVKIGSVPAMPPPHNPDLDMEMVAMEGLEPATGKYREFATYDVLNY
jgi:hypothetical protein